MDSSGSDSRHPSRLLQTGLVPPISGLQTAIDFDFDENEDVDISTEPDPDSDRHWNSFWGSNDAEDDEYDKASLLPD
ncbi:hypothetical protein AAVH_11388 [Aphelenchoides avenae]|nr:hypothetical protein AAVH_11388 [Aphelenchus avenae]